MPRKANNEQIEADVEAYLVGECNRLGAVCKKNSDRRGWFDRTVYWFDGVSDLIECKRPKGGRFEPLQLRTHARLRRMGHSVFVILTRAQVDDYIATRIRFAHPARRG